MATAEYHRNWYHANKETVAPRKAARAIKWRKFLVHVTSEIKLLLGCKFCGYDEHPRALDFHHRDPKMKSFNISNANCRGLMKLLEEISKCDVACANCHRVREAEKFCQVV
jgi:hypothetical protein